MDVISISLENLPLFHEDVCACIGYFDGIHIGHQQLLSKCIDISKQKHTKACMITFDPDPFVIFHPELKNEHITPMEDRIHLAHAFGMDCVYKLEFTKEMASLSIDAFHELLNRLRVIHLVCGFDFKYAYKNTGNIETLKNQSFDMTVIDSINDDCMKISSSRIEPYIKEGKVYKASQLLGYIYSISGVVVHGFQRGSHLLNVPTANLLYNPEYVLPKVGVYAGYALVHNVMYKAMINVGKNPTFDNEELTIEGYILDFNQDIYDQNIRFFFYHFIREEMKFNSIDDLKNQLYKDIQTTKTICSMEDDLLLKTSKLWIK